MNVCSWHRMRRALVDIRRSKMDRPFLGFTELTSGCKSSIAAADVINPTWFGAKRE